MRLVLIISLICVASIAGLPLIVGALGLIFTVLFGLFNLLGLILGAAVFVVKLALFLAIIYLLAAIIKSIYSRLTWRTGSASRH
jgi:hypothetical protein